MLQHLSGHKKMKIGLAIKSIREQLSVKQYVLAERCQLSQTSLSQIENGAKRPSQKTIAKICAVLDIPELVLYVIAMKDTEIPESKKGCFDLLYPSIMALTSQLVDAQHLELINA